ncbi:Fis family transcriptional regulator [Desulfoluna limicola]|uniref:Fis family transcriptional regulator n=1 Tax=Desulfoluna limicola TaxID=2810562 RepID=A0ABN6EYV1_9BACT|nr:sigma-54 dependent transcriptional regulator [Desulfoluna limicola]BCS95487.1 Fis family transcriptional regulator [Desulfoluna limicola]
MKQVLIIDDDPGVCGFMEDIIASMGYGATCAPTLAKGMEMALSAHWDVIFLDVHLPDGSGLAAVSQFRKAPSSPSVIILTGEGTADGAAQAIQSGAWDYIVKPATLDAIRLSLKHVMEIRQARGSASPSLRFKRDSIAGDSPELSDCLAAATDASGSDANVLITGESGTGKELFARAIHDNSPRSKGPFVVVDCAALPETLVESVLFGHEKGAFTGATRSQEGLIREADGGTIFLDELGELSPSNQKRFLRVLQEKRIRAVGGDRETEVDFRLIAATHRDIEGLVREGAFREDLLFRIRSLTITLPPLRIRRGDTHIIAMRAVGTCCHRFGLADKGFYPEFLEALTRYPWPGNARELIAAVEAAVIRAKTEPLLHPIHLPVHIRTELAQAAVHDSTTRKVPSIEPLPRALDTLSHAEHMEAAEKSYLQEIATLAEKRIQEMCRLTDLSRAQIYRLIKKHNITL